MEKIILDTETTGLNNDDEIIEICLIGLDGNILLNTLIKPTKPIPEHASRIHGIYDKDVEDAPLWSDVYQDFINIIKDKEVNIYNGDFDIEMINNTSDKYKLKNILHINYMDKASSYFNEFEYSNYHCVMLEYADIWGDFHEYYGNNRWQRLSDAAEQQSIDISDLTTHRAYADCEITRRLLLKIINDECIEDPQNEIIRKEKEIKKIKAEKSAKYRAKVNKLKNKLLPKKGHKRKYKDYGMLDRPKGYKTYSQLNLRDLKHFKYAGTCCNSKGELGYLFKPKNAPRT